MSLIRQMGYIILATPEPEASADDLSSIAGLRITKRNPQGVYLSSNARQCEVAYLHGSKAGVRAIGLEAVDADAVKEIERRARTEGIKILDDRPLLSGVECAVRFATPMGPIFEVHTPIERRRAEPALMTTGRRVRRLEHVNLRVSDPKAFSELATKLLEMKLSDRTENYERAWYRAADGFHHTFAAGPGSGIHHYAFDAYSVLNLVEVADDLVARGRSLLWGVGRHGPGNNIFSYYRDPNGCVVEVSWGMERIDCDLSHQPGVWPFGGKRNVLDLWGSTPPAAYGSALTGFIE